MGAVPSGDRYFDFDPFPSTIRRPGSARFRGDDLTMWARSRKRRMSGPSTLLALGPPFGPSTLSQPKVTHASVVRPRPGSGTRFSFLRLRVSLHARVRDTAECTGSWFGRYAISPQERESGTRPRALERMEWRMSRFGQHAEPSTRGK